MQRPGLQENWPHAQQQRGPKQVTSTRIHLKGSQQGTDGRRSAISDLQTHPDVFTSRNHWLLGEVVSEFIELATPSKTEFNNRCISEHFRETRCISREW